MKKTERCALIFDCCGDNQWMMGIYDSYEEALGAVMHDIIKDCDDIEENTRHDEEYTVTLERREDDFSGAYMEIKARYSETSHNSELEHIYRIYFEPEVKGHGL